MFSKDIEDCLLKILYVPKPSWELLHIMKSIFKQIKSKELSLAQFKYNLKFYYKCLFNCFAYLIVLLEFHTRCYSYSYLLVYLINDLLSF